MRFGGLLLTLLFDGFRGEEREYGAGSPESESQLRCFLFGVTPGRSLTLGRLSILICRAQRLKPALLPCQSPMASLRCSVPVSFFPLLLGKSNHIGLTFSKTETRSEMTHRASAILFDVLKSLFLFFPPSIISLQGTFGGNF